MKFSFGLQHQDFSLRSVKIYSVILMKNSLNYGQFVWTPPNSSFLVQPVANLWYTSNSNHGVDIQQKLTKQFLELRTGWQNVVRHGEIQIKHLPNKSCICVTFGHYNSSGDWCWIHKWEFVRSGPIVAYDVFYFSPLHRTLFRLYLHSRWRWMTWLCKMLT